MSGVNYDVLDIVVIGGGASGLMLAANLDLRELRRPGQGGAAGAEQERAAGAEQEGAAGAEQEGAAGIEQERAAGIEQEGADGIEWKAVRGLLLEGSARLGSKLLMSGGGHCNITHGGPARDLVGAYGGAGRGLRSCLYKHNNFELVRWLDDHGVSLADENGEPVEPSEGVKAIEGVSRIFLESMKAQDVLDALRNEAEWNGWQTETDAKVCGLRWICHEMDAELDEGDEKQEIGGETGELKDGDRTESERDGIEPENMMKEAFWEITLENGYESRAKNVVIATGGITYPETGSDGSMFGLLEDLGVEVTELRPALAPVYVEDYPYADLAGVSVPNVTVIAFSSSVKAAKMKGGLLFTHEGLSGPVILNISRYLEPGGKIRLIYNKEIGELPRSMQKKLRDRARGPLGDVKTNVLASLLAQDDFTVERIDVRGMVTNGGVSLDETDMKTMRVKRFDEPDAGAPDGSDAGARDEFSTLALGAGMYVIGEALDADGITGGYNLQLCWSTACAAADDLRSKLQ